MGGAWGLRQALLLSSPVEGLGGSKTLKIINSDTPSIDFWVEGLGFGFRV